MLLESVAIIESGIAALLFAASFLLGGRLRLLRSRFDQPSLISFGGGMSIAYVFVYLMPEMHEARLAFADSMSVKLRFGGMLIYFLALVGFLVFYGLDHLRVRMREESEEGEAGPSFKLQIAGFAVYAWTMSYLLVRSLETAVASIGLYAAAMTFHFIGVARSLHYEHGDAYQRVGRFVLATAVMLGWAAGLLFALPEYALALMVAFVSGAIIMNSTIMELPSARDARFMPFVAGGVLYGLLLVPLG